MNIKHLNHCHVRPPTSEDLCIEPEIKVLRQLKHYIHK